MPETGNNIPDHEKILSIRLTPDGFYFSVMSRSDGTEESCAPIDRSKTSVAEAVEGVVGSRSEFSGEFSAVQIFLDTADTVYVPEEALEAGLDVAAWLNAAGIMPAGSERAVVSPSVGDVCAVMSFDAKAIDCLKGKFGPKAAFFSPLQENIEIKGRLDLKEGGCIVNLTENNFYITSFGSGGELLVAEVYPYGSDADIVYYLHELTAGKAAGAADRKGAAGRGKAVGRKTRIYLIGSRAERYRKVIRKYFKGAVCV